MDQPVRRNIEQRLSHITLHGKPLVSVDSCFSGKVSPKTEYSDEQKIRLEILSKKIRRVQIEMSSHRSALGN